jgi:hypothetical protein
MTPEETVKAYNHKYGLDKPLPEGFGNIEEQCENSTGSTWSHDCGVCPYCLSQVSLSSLLRAVIRKIIGK